MEIKISLTEEEREDLTAVLKDYIINKTEFKKDLKDILKSRKKIKKSSTENTILEDTILSIERKIKVAKKIIKELEK